MSQHVSEIGKALNELIDTAYNHLANQPAPEVRNLWQAFLGCIEEASQCYWHIRQIINPGEEEETSQALFDQAELPCPF